MVRVRINMIHVERRFDQALADPFSPNIKRFVVIDTKSSRNLCSLGQTALQFKECLNLFGSGAREARFRKTATPAPHVLSWQHKEI
jgi:hypothetical protein